jgi:hypothetical protein
MTPLKTKADDAETSVSLLGVRISIWGIVIVMACGAIGAFVGRSLYSSEAVFGAFAGVLLGPGMLSWLVRRKRAAR